MKRRITIALIFAVALLAGFWYIGYKVEQPVPFKDDKELYLCLDHQRLNITIVQSTSYLAACRTHRSKDTLYLSIFTSPIYSPSAKKVGDTIIIIDPDIRYIHLAHDIISLRNIHNCSGPYLNN